MREQAELHEGRIVPSSLELLVVGFASGVRALHAALGVRAAVAAADPLFEAPVAIATHAGRCLALGRNGRAEFFGETLHRGQVLLGDCPSGGIALSASFAADRGVAVAIHESGREVSVEASAAGPYAGRRVTILR